jgi:hypothetical protein
MNTNNEIIETIKQNLNESISKIKSLDCINNYNKNNYMKLIIEIHQNEIGYNRFINEVHIKDIIYPSEYIKPISLQIDNKTLHTQIKKVNNMIDKIDNKFINSKTLRDIKLFLSSLNAIHRSLTKLRDTILEMIYMVDYHSKTTTGQYNNNNNNNENKVK